MSKLEHAAMDDGGFWDKFLAAGGSCGPNGSSVEAGTIKHSRIVSIVRKQDSRVRAPRLGPFAPGCNCLSIILQKSRDSALTQAYGQLLTQVFGHEASSHGMGELRVMSQLPVRLGIPCRCQSRQLGQVAHRVPRHVFVCWRHRPHRGWSATRSTR